MKKIVLAAVCAATVLVTGIFANAMERPGFRKFPWGTEYSQIVENEKSELQDKGADYLVYRTMLFGYNFQAAYVFKDKKLYMGKYMLIDKFEDLNKYIEVFDRLKGILQDKYGKPKEDRAIWHDSRLEFEKENWGKAVGYGHVQFATDWGITNTDINIQLRGVNSKCFLQIQYRDIRVAATAEETQMSML